MNILELQKNSLESSLTVLQKNGNILEIPGYKRILKLWKIKASLQLQTVQKYLFPSLQSLGWYIQYTFRIIRKALF